MVNYKSSDDTIVCVESIQKCKFNYKIIIIDNSVDECEYEKLKNLECESIKVVFSDKNYGFAKANNIGLKYIPNNQYVWFLNNDTKIDQNLVNKILENLPDDKTVVYFDIFDFNGKKESDGMHYVNLLTGSFCRRKIIFYKGYICGASLLLYYTNNMPKWDENYFLYFEDIDYTFRLKKNGYKFLHIDDCFVNHKVGGSSSQNKELIKIRLLSQYYFIKKNGICLSLYVLLKIIYLLLSGRIVELVCLINIKKQYRRRLHL
jgi:GT2 family glycosyltransferase